MNKYRYVRMCRKHLQSTFVAKGELEGSSHREAIELMADMGYRFVGTVPVEVLGGGQMVTFDMVFEKIEEFYFEDDDIE